jgi:hypothetical protein
MFYSAIFPPQKLLPKPRRVNRCIGYDRMSSTGYLLFLGDRLVWEMES